MSLMPVWELWIPTPDGSVLTRESASYIGYEQFGRRTEGVVFAPGEGLPGRVWATRCPEVMSTLNAPSAFVRARDAAEADLSAAIGIPILHGHRVTAVLVILYAQGPEPTGLMEVWVPDPAGSQLRWESGFYGQLDDIQQQSMAMTFPPGLGLPGRVWQSRVPEIVEALWPATPGEFVREELAMIAGLSTGLALPIIDASALRSIVMLLSTSDMPFAQVLEVWRPSADGSVLERSGGFYGRRAQFAAGLPEIVFARGEGLPGTVWESQTPRLITSLDASSGFVRFEEALSVDLSVGVGIPTIDHDQVTAVVVLLN